MSVWKKASKAHQKTHRERHQPDERKKLGLLEKKKDYTLRAKDFNEKKATLKLLRSRALNKNPDEFYHHMINSKLEDNKHFEKETEQEDSPDQLKLMRTQDLKYITFKRTQELKKIEKLQAQLHMCSVNHGFKNKHVIFHENLEGTTDEPNKLLTKKMPDIDMKTLTEASKHRKSMYNELSKRVLREKELAIIQSKLELRRNLENKKNVSKPKKVKKASVNGAAVYKWKFERKR